MMMVVTAIVVIVTTSITSIHIATITIMIIRLMVNVVSSCDHCYCHHVGFVFCLFACCRRGSLLLLLQPLVVVPLLL